MSAPSRKVVVLRQGPPVHRSAIIDGAVGVVGVALLVFAGVLGEVLPEPDVVPVQFQTDFPLNNTNAAVHFTEADGTEHFSQGGFVFNGLGENPPMLMEGDSFDIDILVEHDNVISFNVRVVVQADDRVNGDDYPSSLPDNFRFQLFDPEGEPIEDHWRVSTRPPQQVPPDPEDPNNATTLYLSPRFSHSELKRFRGQPEAEFIGSEDPDFSREEALLIASEEYTLPSRDTVWTLRITLDSAGDCEPASPDPDVLRRRGHCLSQTDGTGEDPGNPIILSQVLYDYYLIEVTE